MQILIQQEIFKEVNFWKCRNFQKINPKPIFSCENHWVDQFFENINTKLIFENFLPHSTVYIVLSMTEINSLLFTLAEI